jgi:hypothetical protein
VLVCVPPTSVSEVPEETPLSESDVEVTSVPLGSVAVPTEEAAAGVELDGIGETMAVDVVSEAADIEGSLVVIDVVEFACLGFRLGKVCLQSGFASAGRGPEIKEAPTARRCVPGRLRAEANDVLARRPRRRVDFIL